MYILFLVYLQTGKTFLVGAYESACHVACILQVRSCCTWVFCTMHHAGRWCTVHGDVL